MNRREESIYEPFLKWDLMGLIVRRSISSSYINIRVMHHQKQSVLLQLYIPKAYLWENVAIMWTLKIAGMFSSHTASSYVTMTYMQILSNYKLDAKQ